MFPPRRVRVAGAEPPSGPGVTGFSPQSLVVAARSALTSGSSSNRSQQGAQKRSSQRPLLLFSIVSCGHPFPSSCLSFPIWMARCLSGHAGLVPEFLILAPCVQVWGSPPLGTLCIPCCLSGKDCPLPPPDVHRCSRPLTAPGWACSQE